MSFDDVAVETSESILSRSVLAHDFFELGQHEHVSILRFDGFRVSKLLQNFVNQKRICLSLKSFQTDASLVEFLEDECLELPSLLIHINFAQFQIVLQRQIGLKRQGEG